MESAESDYQPGDAPVPVGTRVHYRGGVWTVQDHTTPDPGLPEPDVNYPDGVAYVLWPEGVEVRFGNRDRAMVRVRRISFRTEPGPDA